MLQWTYNGLSKRSTQGVHCSCYELGCCREEQWAGVWYHGCTYVVHDYIMESEPS